MTHKRGLENLRKASKADGDDVTFSRFVKTKAPAGEIKKLPRKQWKLPGIDKGNSSIQAGRSIFHARGVKSVAAVGKVLVSGHSNVKIGRDVRKGPFRGYWIYTLSLEERATCPRSCHHWRTCYGNNMPYAKRVQHGPELEAALDRELPALLGMRGRVGILVRLHALGDFYSWEYVDFWRRMLALHPRLAVYGYTAHAPDSEIGRAVGAMNRAYSDRCFIRYSNGGRDTWCTVPIRSVDERVNAIVCPEQTGKVDGCGKCGLCWQTPRNIAFIEH